MDDIPGRAITSTAMALSLKYSILSQSLSGQPWHFMTSMFDETFTALVFYEGEYLGEETWVTKDLGDDDIAQFCESFNCKGKAEYIHLLGYYTGNQTSRAWTYRIGEPDPNCQYQGLCGYEIPQEIIAWANLIGRPIG